MKFRFGRKDCIPDKTENLPYDFATMKPEGQENPHENIGPLLKHLKANLNMNIETSTVFILKFCDGGAILLLLVS